MRRTRRLLASALVGLAARAAGGEPLAAMPPASAAEDYALHCAACHRFDGRGVPDVVPTLHGVGRLLDTAGGRAYLVQVPGVAQAPLGDARLARLLDWVLLRFSGAAPVPPYTASEVGALRRTPLRDPGATRAGLGAHPVPR